MKQVLLIALAATAAFTADAQKKKSKKAAEPAQLPPPRVWIANIPSYNTTYDAIMANPLMVTDSPGCRVSVFTISLTAPGEPFYGPINAIGDKMNEMQQSIIKNWKDKKNITLHIQDIHLNCHETDATSPALEYYYNEEK